MHLPMLSMFIDQTKIYMSPVQYLNNLAVTNAEKLISFQVESMRNYVDLGAAQLKAAAEVEDPESFFRYASRQSEYMFKVGAQAVADINKVISLATNLVSGSQNMAERNVGAVKKLPTKKVARRAAT